MSDISYIETPLYALEHIGESGKIVPDPLGSSTNYYKPDEAELAQLNKDFFDEITAAENELGPLRSKAAQHERAYHMVDESTDGAFFVYPLVRREVDFNTGWLVSTITKAEPLISIDPAVNRKYTVFTEDEEMGVGEVQIPAERAIQELEITIEHMLREFIRVTNFLRVMAKETKMGKGPVWAKIGYVPKDRYEKVPVVRPDENGDRVIVDSNEWVKKTDPFPIKWIPKSINDMLYRVGFDNPEDLPWIGERDVWSQQKLKELLTTYGDANLLSEDEMKKVYEMMPVRNADKENSQALQGNVPMGGSRSGINVAEVYWRHPVPYKVMAEDGKEVKRIEFFEMGGYYLIDSQAFACIWFNDFAFQDKPYVPFFNDKVPFQIADSSSVDELVPIQAWIVEALTLSLENRALANNTGFLINENSPAWDYFGSTKLEPGFRAPGQKDDVTPVTFGRDSGSLLPEIEWLINKADRVGDVRRGERVPGRTSPNTVAQIMQSAVNQEFVALQSFEDSLIKLLKYTLMLYRQFNPGGAQVVMTGEDGQAVKFPLRIPLDLDINELRFRLTAASDLAQRESGFEDLLMISQQLDADANVTAMISKALIDGRITDGLAMEFERLIQRKQYILDSLMSKLRIDSKDMTVSDEILAQIRQDREMLKQQAMQMKQQMQAQGGMNAGGGQPVQGTPTPTETA